METAGFTADAANWLKLRTISRFFGGRQQMGNTTNTDTSQGLHANPSGKGYVDELLMWLALAHSVDMSKPVDAKVTQSLRAFIELVRKNIGSNAVRVFYQIIGMRSSETVIDEQQPLSQRRRQASPPQKKMTTNELGARILLWIHETSPAEAFGIIRELGLLDNPNDKLAKKGRSLEEKLRLLSQQAANWWKEHQIELIEQIAREAFSSQERFDRVMADPTIKGHRECFERATGAEKDVWRKRYTDELWDVVESYRNPKHIRGTTLPGTIDDEARFDERQKPSRKWYYIGALWGTIIIASLAMAMF